MEKTSNKSNQKPTNSITIEEMYEGQEKNFLDIAETLEMFKACIAKLTENYLELKNRVEALERGIK